MSKVELIAVYLGIGVALGSCGSLTAGGGVANDPLPAGLIVSQGSFGTNANGITGFVSVYKQDCPSTCTFVIRIQNLVAPTATNVQVVASGNNLGSPTLSAALRLPTGSQNFTFSTVPGNAVFSSVSLHPGSFPIGQNDFATAPLTVP